MGEVEGSKRIAAGEFCIGCAPMQSARNHEVDDEPEIAVEAEGDAFAHIAQLAHGVAVDGGKWRVDGSEEKRRGDADLFERLAKHARLKRFKVGQDVGELGHSAEFRRYLIVRI